MHTSADFKSRAIKKGTNFNKYASQLGCDLNRLFDRDPIIVIWLSNSSHYPISQSKNLTQRVSNFV